MCNVQIKLKKRLINTNSYKTIELMDLSLLSLLTHLAALHPGPFWVHKFFLLKHLDQIVCNSQFIQNIRFEAKSTFFTFYITYFGDKLECYRLNAMMVHMLTKNQISIKRILYYIIAVSGANIPNRRLHLLSVNSTTNSSNNVKEKLITRGSQNTFHQNYVSLFFLLKLIVIVLDNLPLKSR